jgi:hypothetical protein
MTRRMKLLEFQRQKQLNQRKLLMRIMTWNKLRDHQRCLLTREYQLRLKISSKMQKDMVPQKNISGKVRS